MADTIQIVRWTLGRSCALRSATAVHDPSEALTSISRAHTLSRYFVRKSPGFGVFGDVCVTGCTFAEVPKHLKSYKGLHYPYSGFIPSQEFASIGGVEGLVAMCKRCPANSTPGRPAGCAGTIYQYPDSPETQQQLQSIISSLGLEVAVREAFPNTQPLWYGFWARSSLSPQAIEVLSLIMERMLEEDRAEISLKPEGDVRGHLLDLETFVRALRIAEMGQLSLFVSMAAPGHTDLGFYTVFPHCPFCKAGARLERWKKQYATQLHTCHVCGTRYPPAETASSERSKYESEELRDLLGPQFQEFARRYLIEQGLDEGKASLIVEATEQAEAERQAKVAQERRRRERQQAYVETVLYAGLHPVSHEPDDEDEVSGDKLFNSEEFSILLR